KRRANRERPNDTTLRPAGGRARAGKRDTIEFLDLLRPITAAIGQLAIHVAVFDEKAGHVKYALRSWKCRNCGRSNSTEIALDGTGVCAHCSYLMQVQPSRIRNGVVLPA